MFKKPQTAEDIMKWTIIGSVLFVVIIIGLFTFSQAKSGKVQKGEKDQSKAVTELSKDHVEDINKVKYNSNPPTSGKHFQVWAKPGKYSQVISDGYLIHSLEHGYINISYNCDKLPDAKAPFTKVDRKLLSQLPKDKSEQYMIAGSEPTVIKLSPNFSLSSCKTLVDGLVKYLKVEHRVILVPRPDMESVIALTAWGRIDAMNSIDDGRIKGFIHAYHNHGPEQTME